MNPERLKNHNFLSIEPYPLIGIFIPAFFIVSHMAAEVAAITVFPKSFYNASTTSIDGIWVQEMKIPSASLVSASLTKR